MPLSDLSPAEIMARALDPTLILRDAGFPEPHPEQAKVLRDWRKDHMLLWSRQGAKSTTGACLAVHNFLFKRRDTKATIPIVSKAQRQSGELFVKARELYFKLPYREPLTSDRDDLLELRDGSRILAYPGSEETVRSLSAATVGLIDEATLCERALRDAISPMLLTTGGPLWCLATARGRSGWFFDSWTSTKNSDVIVKSRLTYKDIPHLNTPEALQRIAIDKQEMPDWRFRNEYLVEFADDDQEALITTDIIQGCVNPNERAFW